MVQASRRLSIVGFLIFSLLYWCPAVDGQEIGACCDEITGSCYECEEWDCFYMWLGPGSSCSECMVMMPYGACCRYNGDCWETEEHNCYDGEWLGAWTGCSECPSYTGACCEEDGNCTEVLEMDCHGGTFKGYGTTCDQCGEKWSRLPDPSGTGVIPENYLADDFVCNEPELVKSITVWGMWLGDVLPNGNAYDVEFELRIHENIPAAQSPTGYAIPGPQLYLSRTFSAGVFSVDLYSQGNNTAFYVPSTASAGYGYGDEYWQYTFELYPGEFYQEGGGQIYWLSLVALPEDGGAVFTWVTTSPWQGSTSPALWNDLGDWEQLWYPSGHWYSGEPMDMAFSISGPFGPLGGCCNDWDGTCYLATQWECQHMWLGSGDTCSSCTAITGACCRWDGSCEITAGGMCDGIWTGGSDCSECTMFHGACCRDDGTCEVVGEMDCTEGAFLGAGTDCDQCDQKYFQRPNYNDYERVVLSAVNPTIVADDFVCTEFGYITQFIVWGSWLYEYPPGNDPYAVTFTVNVHENTVVGDANVPGEVLWSQSFAFDDFSVEEIHYASNSFYDPNSGFYAEYSASRVWKYKLYPDDPQFLQEGMPEAPIKYWLSVSAVPLDGEARFGWVNSGIPYPPTTEPAVFRQGSDPWEQMAYPAEHPAEGLPIDLAFAIIGPPTEACCFTDGSCEDLNIDLCGYLGGMNQGAGERCANVTCPVMEEACCMPDGSCIMVPLGSSCEGVLAGSCEDCAEHYGACCRSDASCEVTLDVACYDGHWVGSFTDCDDPGSCYWQPMIEFSLDIGSDHELSDPGYSGDEGFDPGDVYLWRSAVVVHPGRDGAKDDATIFGSDPDPVAPDSAVPAATRVPIGSGSVADYVNYFDLDGHDVVGAFILGMLDPDNPLTEAIHQEWFQNASSSVYQAKFLAVSFDDDGAISWAIPDVPVNTSGGITFGTTAGRDEIVGVTLDMSTPSPYAIAEQYPIVDETGLHLSLRANPDNNESDDDDVDSLDIGVYQLDWLFSADHEANLNLDAGHIYKANPADQPVKVIDKAIHLGLTDDAGTVDVVEDADVDAFEFVWMQQVEGGDYCLALLFSVDQNDPLTGSIDESGGLNPNMIYVSFLNGVSGPLLQEPLAYDIDALSNWYRKIYACNLLPFDTNDDTVVNLPDYADFAECFRTLPADWPGLDNFYDCLCLDRDSDGDLDLYDLSEFTDHWLVVFAP